MVDERALSTRLSGPARSPGPDSTSTDEEPLRPDHPFRRLSNTVITPHLGYVTEETYRIFYSQALEDVRALVSGARPGPHPGPVALDDSTGEGR